MFRGRLLPSDVPTVDRWEIETTIEGRLIEPVTNTVVYLKRYPSWEDGVVMAMQEALARIVCMHGDSIDVESGRQFFGRRSSLGLPMRTSGSREGLSWIQIQFEDMERYAYKVETLLRAEMCDLDFAKHTLTENNKKYKELERLIEWLADKRDALFNENVQLKKDNEKLLDKTLDQEAVILALQGQCAHLPLATPEDQEMEEEEDPEEVEFILLNGETRLIVAEEEDTPATNTRSHTPRMSARTYRNLFKTKI
ncbi:hypothetical protein QYE76_024388 [Lolium multiflorum]|uniref:Uncharacterized protein n=1 Tax=Lolium multiflorum TaxID=4521 RepID=A0AAD8RDK8_LOLMU|nr:hypothetical protein QYE76_024388 [Lolium multiflorum]